MSPVYNECVLVKKPGEKLRIEANTASRSISDRTYYVSKTGCFVQDALGLRASVLMVYLRFCVCSFA